MKVGEERVIGSVTVAVSQQEAAAQAIVDHVRAAGGWFRERTPTAVSLRVPASAYDEVVAFVSSQGKVLDLSLERMDESVELADLRGRLEAREGLLDDYYRVLRTAGTDSVVGVEMQIVSAIGEIEQLRGRVRWLEDQVAHAQLDVNFQFRDRAAPSRSGSSSFRWLNTLNVVDLIDASQVHRPGHRSGGIHVPAPPAGFSAWRQKGRYRAASADGVLFVARSIHRQPVAALSFWKEAVRQRMAGAGYHLVAESDVTAGGVAGAAIELTAPVGTEDWTYFLAFFPQGKTITVVEAGGEVTAFDARRADILAAVGAISP